MRAPEVVPANAGTHTPCRRFLALRVETVHNNERCGVSIPAFAGTTRGGVSFSNRIPIKDISRTVELVERRFQGRHAVLGDGLRRPAFTAMDRAQRARLARS